MVSMVANGKYLLFSSQERKCLEFISLRFLQALDYTLFSLLNHRGHMIINFLFKLYDIGP